MFCFKVGRKYANRSPKRKLQLVRKSNGEIKITRVKRAVSLYTLIMSDLII